MTRLQCLWGASLLMEAGVAIGISRTVWRMVYPRFFGYLVFDLAASLFLFFCASEALPYDVPWRGIPAGGDSATG